MKENTLSDRIQKIIEKEDLSVRSFEASIGCSYGVIYRFLNKGTDISSHWLLKIINKYPHYNVEWIITGVGDVIKGETKTKHPHNNQFDLHQDDLLKEIMRLKEECYEKGNRIIALLDENAALKKEIEKMRKATE